MRSSKLFLQHAQRRVNACAANTLVRPRSRGRGVSCGEEQMITVLLESRVVRS